jgi:phosphoglycerol geranylgeranyltransferase
MKFRKLTIRLAEGSKPLLAVLVDPDKYNPELIRLANSSKIDCFLVGGSKLENGDTGHTIRSIQSISRVPVVIFPGDESQLSPHADGLLLLSLLSGRNPEYLIEKHIRAAPLIRKMKLPHLSTAYLLIRGGKTSSTQRITGTMPLNPADVNHIVNTAIAAEQLGFGAIYLEAGSGARNQVNSSLIKKIKKAVSIPLIVGGGINSRERALAAIRAGANMIVVGNALEKDVYLLAEISSLF